MGMVSFLPALVNIVFLRGKPQTNLSLLLLIRFIQGFHLWLLLLYMFRILLLMMLLLFRYIGSSNDGMGLGAVLPALVNIIILATGPDIKEYKSTIFTLCILLQIVLLV